MMNINLIANEFLSVFAYLYNTDELIGTSFSKEYPFGNDSLDSNIDMFLEENNYQLTEEERKDFFDFVYEYEF